MNIVDKLVSVPFLLGITALSIFSSLFTHDILHITTILFSMLVLTLAYVRYLLDTGEY